MENQTSVVPSSSSSPLARDMASALFAHQLISCPTWRSHRGMNTTHQFQSTCITTSLGHFFSSSRRRLAKKAEEQEGESGPSTACDGIHHQTQIIPCMHSKIPNLHMRGGNDTTTTVYATSGGNTSVKFIHQQPPQPQPQPQPQPRGQEHPTQEHVLETDPLTLPSSLHIRNST